MKEILMNRHLRTTVFFVALICFFTFSAATAELPALPWDSETLFETPQHWPAEGFEEEGLQAFFYKGPSYRDKPTRIFAWYGAPETGAGEKSPAMVLVHGGGGTAFARWVRLWVERGYCAIAMDTCGCIPRGEYGNWERHPDGGPAGWGGFDAIETPVTDHWTYHAVAGIVRAHSLLRSFPEVDPERIGITGISWGGYLTCITAGVDPRFKCAVPVYGCGFLGENSTWLETFTGMGEANAAAWLALWDPSVYLPRAAMPLLWITGTNDFAYPLDSLQKSYRLPGGERTLCIRVRMPHGHGEAGENPEEIHAFANSVLRSGQPLPKITRQEQDGQTAHVTFTSERAIAGAELVYTLDTGKWQDRHWESERAVLDRDTEQSASAAIPPGTTTFYMNLTDETDLVVSSEHVVLIP